MNKHLLYTLAICLCSLGFVACSDDDDDIEISSLTGTWTRVYNDPNLSVDGSISYTFNADSTWSVRHSDYLSGGDTTIYGEKYIVSSNRYMHMYVDMADYPHLYANPNNVSCEIQKLTSDKMTWKVTLQDANYDFVYYTWYFEKVK